jgi:hypothetical protein
LVPEALSKRIHGVIGLMLIYGNTPGDIMAMIWRRRKKFMMAFAVIVIAVMLTSCGSRKTTPPLNVLDQFWKTLGSGKNSTGVE